MFQAFLERIRTASSMVIVRIRHIQFRVSPLPAIGSELPSFADIYFEPVSNVVIC